MKKTNRKLRTILILVTLMILAISSRTFAAGISKKSLTIPAGESTKLSVSGVKKVSWKSSKKSVASVSGKGVVKAKKAGTCKITAKAGKKTFTCKVTVVKKEIDGSASASTAAVSAPDTSSMSEQEIGIYQMLIAKRAQYPEGRHWTNSNYYRWNGGLYGGGYGCAAFAFALSDAAFGDAPATKHYNASQIRVGDILRVEDDTHMVIVLSVSNSGLVVAEGNYNDSIHWGRKISPKELHETLDYVITRY